MMNRLTSSPFNIGYYCWHKYRWVHNLCGDFNFFFFFFPSQKHYAVSVTIQAGHDDDDVVLMMWWYDVRCDAQCTQHQDFMKKNVVTTHHHLNKNDNLLDGNSSFNAFSSVCTSLESILATITHSQSPAQIFKLKIQIIRAEYMQRTQHTALSIHSQSHI